MVQRDSSLIHRQSGVSVFNRDSLPDYLEQKLNDLEMSVILEKRTIDTFIRREATTQEEMRKEQARKAEEARQERLRIEREQERARIQAKEAEKRRKEAKEAEEQARRECLKSLIEQQEMERRRRALYSYHWSSYKTPSSDHCDPVVQEPTSFVQEQETTFETISDEDMSSDSDYSDTSPYVMSWDTAYMLYSGGGYTQKQIGEMMGCSQPTVSRHFKKYK